MMNPAAPDGAQSKTDVFFNRSSLMRRSIPRGGPNAVDIQHSRPAVPREAMKQGMPAIVNFNYFLSFGRAASFHYGRMFRKFS